MLALAEFLGGFAIGMWLALVEHADAQATDRCVADAQSRVDRLRHDADDHVRRAHRRWAGQMGRDVRNAYEQRLGR
jgi:hypothetical protein